MPTSQTSSRRDVGEAAALERDAAHDAQEVGERQAPARATAPAAACASNGNMKPLQQDVRQEEEERHLHRLLLRLGERREEQAERQVGGDEHERRARRAAAASRRIGTSNTSRPASRIERHLHVADDDVRQDLADHELDVA